MTKKEFAAWLARMTPSQRVVALTAMLRVSSEDRPEDRAESQTARGTAANRANEGAQ